jgi:hypothetical protein
VSHNPRTHGLIWAALNEIASGGDDTGALRAEFREALLAFDSETPDNLNCANRIGIGMADVEIGPVLCGYALSDIAHRLEDEPMPDDVRAAMPALTDQDWDAFMRLTTLLYIALSRPPQPGSSTP